MKKLICFFISAVFVILALASCQLINPDSTTSSTPSIDVITEELTTTTHAESSEKASNDQTESATESFATETHASETTATENRPIYGIPMIGTITNYKIEYKSKDHGYTSSYFMNVVNGEERWRIFFEDLFISKYKEISDGVLIIMETSNPWLYNQIQTRDYFIAKVDFEGNICWQKDLGYLHGLNFYGESIYEYDNGMFAIVYGCGIKQNSSVCVSHFSSDGTLLSNKINTIDYDFTICDIKKTDNGFIVSNIGDTFDEEWDVCSKFICMDNDGNITSQFVLNYPEIEDVNKTDFFYYMATDMMEYNGRIYVSGYYYTDEPIKIEDSDRKYFVFGETDFSVENHYGQELRKRFVGFIVRCNFDGSGVEIIYSEKEKQGGKLYIDVDGNLVCETEKIISVYKNHSVNNPSIGVSRIYVCILDQNGKVISITETGRYIQAKLD